MSNDLFCVKYSSENDLILEKAKQSIGTKLNCKSFHHHIENKSKLNEEMKIIITENERLKLKLDGLIIRDDNE